MICQTRQMAEELQAELGMDNAKLVVLPNPVDIPEIRLSTGANKGRYHFGRSASCSRNEIGAGKRN